MKKLFLVLLAVLAVSPVYAQSTLFSNSTTGNVGIDTTTPAGTLDVEGGTAAASTNGTSINIVAQSAGTGNNNGGNIILSPGAATGTGVAGKVGISTASPANLLDIGTGGGIHITSGIPGSTSMALYNNSGTLTWNGAALATGSSVSGTTNYIPVFTGSASLGNSRIYQSSVGVGIGTVSPAAPLHVYHALPTGTISSSGTTVTGSGSNFTTAFNVGDIIMAGNQNQTITTISSNTSLTTATAFTPALSTGSPYQRVGAIINAGAVGIGQSNPESPLDVWGTPIVNGADRAVLNISDNTPLAANVGGGLQFGGYVTSTTGAEWAGIKSGKINGTSGDYGAYMAS